MARSRSKSPWLRASQVSLASLVGGALVASMDFGAGWLFLAQPADQGLFALQLWLLLPALSCLIGTTLFAPCSWMPRRWQRLTWPCILLSPWHAFIAIKLFSGGKMLTLPHRCVWITSVFVLLCAAVVITQALIERYWPALVRRRLWYAPVMLGLALLATKVDQHAFANLYEFLHGELSLVVTTACSLACALLIEHRVLKNARPAARLVTMSLAVLSVLSLSLAFRTQDQNQNVYVALLSPRAPNAHSALLGLRTLFPKHEVRGKTEALDGPARSLSKDAPAQMANVLLITVDALRPDHLGTYGYERKTSPALDRFAQEAIVFERAYAQAPHSSYSISSLMSSHYIHQLVDLEVGLPNETLASTLAGAGYHTAAFFTEGIFHTEGTRLADFDKSAFGFERFDHTAAPAENMTDMVLAEIHRAQGEQLSPMLVWAHYFDVHEPYRATDFGSSDIDRYDSEIKRTDAAIERLIKSARQLTKHEWVIALTSDHGEEFRDHGGLYHGSTLFDEQIRVPLMFYVPGFEPQRIAKPVELVDVTPTLLSLVGAPIPKSMRGDDLRKLLRGETADWRAPVFGAVTHKRMVVKWPYKLVADLRYGTRELYDLHKDPREDANLAATRTDVIDELMPSIYGWLDSLQSSPEGETISAHDTALGLGRLGDRRAVDPLCDLLGDEQAELAKRLEAARLLTQLSDHNSKQALLDAMRGDNARVAAEAAVALGRMFDPRAQDALRELMKTSDPMLRARAAVSLARLRDPAAVPGLVDALYTHPSRFERDEAIRWLGRLEDPVALEPLLSLLGDSQARHLVLYALGHLGDNRALPALVETLNRERNAFRKNRAVRALGQLGDPAALDSLMPLLSQGLELTNLSESLVRLGAIDRGLLGGVDVGPVTRGRLRPAPKPSDCRARAAKHDWDYRERTWCELKRPTSLRLTAPAKSEPGEIRLRARSAESPNTTLRVRLGDQEHTWELTHTWSEHALAVPKGTPLRLKLDFDAPVGLDHVLVLPASTDESP